MKLEFLSVPNVPDVTPGTAVGKLLLQCAAAAQISIEPSSVIAIAQKIVSKAEGRIVRLSEVIPSPKAAALSAQTGKDARLIEVILRESRRIIRTRGEVLICETHHGFICANAGVDRSNVDGGDQVTLLPRNPDSSARRISSELGCPVIITDTFGRTWRDGLVDVAIGVHGISPLIDYRGASDKYGLPLRATVIAAVDSLAAAAGILMQKNSSTPAVIIRGFESAAAEGSVAELLRPTEKDLFL